MKHILLLIVVVCSFLSSAYGQADTITIEKTIFGPMYEKDGRFMSMHRLKNELKTDPAAFMQFKKGRNIRSVGIGLYFAGCFLIGYELGISGARGGVDPVVMGSGIALACIGFPISISSHKHIKRAVRTYNAGKRRTGNVPYEPELYLAVSGSGVGVVWKF